MKILVEHLLKGKTHECHSHSEPISRHDSKKVTRLINGWGVGTTFKIYFPCVVEKLIEPPARPETGSAMPVGDETILLVEDDTGVRKLLRQVLSKLGYTLLEAGNGQKALRLMAHYPDPIHLLLTDVVMPGISGKLLAEELSRTWPDLKSLFMSGYTNEAIVQHGVLDSGLPFCKNPSVP